MTPDQIANQNAEWARFRAVLRGDPLMAAYLDQRAAYERRRCGLPVLTTPQELAETEWEDERAERACEWPASWGVMDG
jgi:hypothetical protein